MPFYTVFKMACKKWNESYVHTETFRWMLMVALYIITPSWKIPNILILRMDKLCYIFTMEYSPSTENDNYWCLQQYGWISKALGWAKKKVKVKVTQSCLTLCHPTDYMVHGILQARILEWVSVPFSRGSSQPRNWTQVSHIADGFLTSWATSQAWFKMPYTRVDLWIWIWT